MNSYFYIIFLPLHLFGSVAAYIHDQISWLMCAALWVLLSGYGVGVTLHRLLSHRAFTVRPIIEKILSVIACICAQGSPLFWVAIHRGYHHTKADTEADIHSPVNGKLWSYFLWTIKIDPHALKYRSIPDLLRSPFQMKLNQYYFQIVWAAWILAWIYLPHCFIV